MDTKRKELTILNTKFKTLFDTIPSIAWISDVNGVYLEVNRAFITLSGKPLENIIFKTHNDIWGGTTSSLCFQNDNVVITTKKEHVGTELIPCSTGYIYVKVHRSPLFDDENNIVGIIAVAHDITEEEINNTKFQILIENIPFMVCLCDKNGYYLNANSKFANRFNTTVENLIGKNFREFFSEDYITFLLDQTSGPHSPHSPYKIKSNHIIEGKEVYLEVYKTPIYDIIKNYIGTVVTIVNTTEIVENEKKIKDQIYLDYTTGLQNRRALYHFIDNHFKDNYISVFLLDLDNFKYINDTYGHAIGDKALIELSKILVNLYGNEKVYRLSGDEFIVILKNPLGFNYIKTMAQKLLDHLNSYTLACLNNEKITVSIGIASCTCSYKKNFSRNLCKNREYCSKGICNSSNCNLMRNADIALYASKQKGKNRYEFYSKDLDLERTLKVNIHRDLSLDNAKNEFCLFYQPQYCNNVIIGFEALFRWFNPKYRDIPVNEIIEIMEKSNLIIDIGNFIIREACIFARKINKDRESPIIISINVSSIQILNPLFVNNFKGIIEETGVKTNLINIEITESVLLDNMSVNLKKLNEITKLGVKIILDDFGTGYSSLNYFVKMPLHAIKIDKSFVSNLSSSNDYKIITKLIIDCSHSINLKIIAEGVETEEQLNILKDMNVNIFQGYLFSKPVNESMALTLIE